MNRGLLAVAENNYVEAFNVFQKAHEMDKSNVMVSCPFILTLARKLTSAIHQQIQNNLAVCYLYNGKMHEAIAIYENSIKSEPRKNLHETLLLNLATLYELESNDSKKKKIELLKTVSSNIADLEMNVDACLKL